MDWVLSIGCASTALHIAVCGLTGDWTGRYRYQSERDCLETGRQVLALVIGKRDAKKFEIKCQLEGS